MDDTGNPILGCIIILLFLALAVFLVTVPIKIAKNRKLSPGNIKTISILSWLSLLLGVTWIVALVLSLVYTPEEQAASNVDADSLLKLHELKEKGAISQEEFDKKKQQFLK